MDHKDDIHVKRVNFTDKDEETGEEFLFDEVEKVDVQTSTIVEEAEDDVFISELEQVRGCLRLVAPNAAFDQEDVAFLAGQKALLLNAELQSRTSTRALAQEHFETTIREREAILTTAVQRGDLVPGTDTFLFFVKKQAKLVDLAQKLYPAAATKILR